MEKHQLDHTDLLFIPAALIHAYLLQRWLPGAVAIAVALVLLSFAWFVLVDRDRRLKRFMLALLISGLIVYALAMIIPWLP